MVQEKNLCFEGKTLSDEQRDVVQLAAKGRNIVINAFAGTGKTLTLRAVSSLSLSEKRGLYLAFNKKIVDEASAIFPDNVECRTVHSLAYRATASRYAKSGRLRQYLTPSILCEKVFKDIPPMYGIPPIRVCGMILSAIKNFCQSTAKEISSEHINELKIQDVDSDVKAEFKSTLLYFINTVWEMLADPKSDLPITPDVYLKLWALKEPTLKYDFILIDEAQDQTPVVIDLISKQQHLQQIWVGDRYQQIYGFRGAKNAMDMVDAEAQLELTQSYRYGKEIAEFCNRLIDFYFSDSIDIKGFPQMRSKISDELEPNVVICRTNFAVIAELAYLTYIEKKNVAINADVSKLSRELREAQNLMHGRKSTHPEFIPFKDWDELVRFSKSDEGQHLRTLVNLVEQYTIPLLLDLLNRAKSVNEKYADVIVSTVHQVKGCEWDIVRLADDFRGKGHSKYSDEEGRLLYVAATRARSVLDISLSTAAYIPTAIGEES